MEKRKIDMTQNEPKKLMNEEDIWEWKIADSGENENDYFYQDKKEGKGEKEAETEDEMMDSDGEFTKINKEKMVDLKIGKGVVVQFVSFVPSIKNAEDLNNFAKDIDNSLPFDLELGEGVFNNYQDKIGKDAIFNINYTGVDRIYHIERDENNNYEFVGRLREMDGSVIYIEQILWKRDEINSIRRIYLSKDRKEFLEGMLLELKNLEDII